MHDVSRRYKKKIYFSRKSTRTIVYIGYVVVPTTAISHFLFQRSCAPRVLSRNSFISRLYGTWVGQDRSRYTLPGSPRHAAVTVVRFVETSVSGKRDWTTEGNVQEIKLARRVAQKQVRFISLPFIVFIGIAPIISFSSLFLSSPQWHTFLITFKSVVFLYWN